MSGDAWPPSPPPIEQSADCASTLIPSVPTVMAMDTTTTNAPTQQHAGGVPPYTLQVITPVPPLPVEYAANHAAIPCLGV